MPSTQPNTPAGIPNPASPERREQVNARLAGLVEPRSPGRQDRRIGEVIADLGFAKREVVEAAVELARRSGELTGEVLINSGVITAEQLSRALAERHGLDYIDFSVFTPDMGAANLIDANAAKRYSAVPVAFLDETTLRWGEAIEVRWSDLDLGQRWLHVQRAYVGCGEVGPPKGRKARYLGTVD